MLDGIRCGRRGRRGLWIHMGRVNTKRRLSYAYRIGCDSVDGSQWSRWSDTWIKWGLDHVEATKRQAVLAVGGEGL
jgi:hypothetical protein